MRRSLAGIFLLLLFPAAALAQFKGEVESIGFNSCYRPNCFVPMLIRIQAQTSGTYQIHVVQEDLDRDLEVFAQTISLTGAEDGKGAEQRFWMYFVPQPGDQGLRDATQGGNLRDLQQQLKVFLTDEKGTKQLAQLTVTSTIQNIEAFQGGPSTASRGNRMILTVTDGPAQPVWRDYQQAIGTMEDVIFVPVRSADLPEDVRGYEMIDGIVWLAAPLPDRHRPSDEKRFRAIQDYVRGGGHLVICQPAQRDATATFAEMLPVDVQAVAPRNDLEPLRTLAKQHQQIEPEPAPQASQAPPNNRRNRAFNPSPAPPPQNPIPIEEPKPKRDPWTLPTGPFMFARAQAKPGSFVDDPKLKWDDGTETPYIARRGYGLGCVTWVAHDLSDPSITNRAKSGWPYVWDRVLDYKHDLTIVDQDTPETIKQRYGAMPGVDLSTPLIDKMQLTAKSRTLISIAVVFFIAYWALAGPGVYFYLLTRSRPQLSWFMFAFSAVVATLLTVLVVKLVVRGAPEIAHITVIRGGVGMPQVSISRFGLYIPRDGSQEIILPEAQPRQVSYVIADPRHPKDIVGSIEFPAQERYAVPIHDANEDEPVKITVPFRSTAKEFEARRVGPAGGAIQGSGKLRETEARNLIEGIITNGTGNRLRNVYLVYHDPRRQDDVAFFLPTMEKSQSVDLRDLNDISANLKWLGDRNGNTTGQPDENVRLWGLIGKPGVQPSFAWVRYWYSAVSSTKGGDAHYGDLSRALPMMSVFNRLPPVRNGWKDGQNGERFEILRRGGRYLDCSNVVASGQLLVLAEPYEQDVQPLPFPLLVEGDKVSGHGTVYYQFALPLERIPAPPATQPASTKPATTTRPAAEKINVEHSTSNVELRTGKEGIAYSFNIGRSMFDVRRSHLLSPAATMSLEFVPWRP